MSMWFNPSNLKESSTKQYDSYPLQKGETEVSLHISAEYSIHIWQICANMTYICTKPRKEHFRQKMFHTQTTVNCAYFISAIVLGDTLWNGVKCLPVQCDRNVSCSHSDLAWLYMHYDIAKCDKAGSCSQESFNSIHEAAKGGVSRIEVWVGSTWQKCIM